MADESRVIEPVEEPEADHSPDVLAENVLVEEVSIDGMCGVY